jgi:hypothetical protein
VLLDVDGERLVVPLASVAKAHLRYRFGEERKT